MISHVADTPGRGDLIAAVRQIAPVAQEWVELRRRTLRTPGVQVAIRVGGELLASFACGSADVENEVPLTTRHLFRIASHSKTFAATAVMMLAADGKLRLDDVVGQHVSALADTAVGDRRVRELLGHQGGVIRDGDDCDYWQLVRDFPDTQTLLSDLRRDGVTFERNEHFKYSNYGYSVIGLVIEAASGMGFAEFVRERILEPLDLPRISPDIDGIDPAELACGHSLLLDGADEVFVLANPSARAMASATGFVACAEDLTAYASAHTMGDERLLSDGDKRLMQRTESIVVADRTELGRYGLGMDLQTIGDRQTVGHSGGFPGFVTRTFIDPQDGLVVSVLTNASRGPAHQLAVGIVKLIDLALAKKDATVGTAGGEAGGVDLDSFCTTVVAGFGRLAIARIGGALMLLHPDLDDLTTEAIELAVLDADRLQISARPGYGSAGEPVTYRREDGAITQVRIGGMSMWPEEVFRARRRSQMAR